MVLKELISQSTISIKAPVAQVWEALIRPEKAKIYFFGAAIKTNWEEGSPITFKGEYQGNHYEEKGVILRVDPNIILQYYHWSPFDGLPDLEENYRIWTFELAEMNGNTDLTISEDNIPTEKQKIRSDEFWKEVLIKIKGLVEENKV
jgi:uncharacterized protein YndB with AHSA1/START domain